MMQTVVFKSLRLLVFTRLYCSMHFKNERSLRLKIACIIYEKESEKSLSQSVVTGSWHRFGGRDSKSKGRAQKSATHTL